MTILTSTESTMDTDQDNKPRHMVFSKMEKIIRAMQQSVKGVPVRSQKMFLTTIPCAFTGYDLVEWLKSHLQMTENSQALHLASLLCQYGYFFPASDLKMLAVKDDNSLYRFQSPYYWPSHNVEPDNVSYGIHLVKRSMRNKQKHGLEDHEQVAINKLQKMLCDKWEFIVKQAEEQVRLTKERKKADKVILDSQERAYWRIHRPPPGHFKCLDEGPKYNFPPSQIAARKRKNKDLYKKEIAYYKRALNRPRLKCSKAIENHITRTETYLDLDPMLSAPHPSNPWISYEPMLWTLNTSLVDIPTNCRVKRWGFDINEILKDPTGQAALADFLNKEYSQENIRFWRACETLKFSAVSEVANRVEDIYTEFLEHGAPCEINIDSATMENVLNNLKNPDRYTFQAAQNHIYLLMKKDSYVRFLRSEHYKYLLANSFQPSEKKRLFNFGSSRRKTMTSNSPSVKRRNSVSSSGTPEHSSSVVGQHSYSTGNLRELEDKNKPYRCSYHHNGSDSSLNTRSDGSPSHGNGDKYLSSPQRRNLEVPSPFLASNTKELQKGEQSSCVAISVPLRTNAVAPWDG